MSRYVPKAYLAWAFEEPDPAGIVASMKEDARRVLATTTSPPGYEPAPDRTDTTRSHHDEL
jgi:hypothetical protein